VANAMLAEAIPFIFFSNKNTVAVGGNFNSDESVEARITSHLTILVRRAHTHQKTSL